jgi:hypothetical protein
VKLSNSRKASAADGDAEGKGLPDAGEERRSRDIALLMAERDRINAEIRSYPTPITACDQQFNFLLEERTRIAIVLEQLR